VAGALTRSAHRSGARFARARARTREHVWSLIERRRGRIPPSRVADRDLGSTIVIRLDASIMIAHSDTELTAGTYKGSWGHRQPHHQNPSSNDQLTTRSSKFGTRHAHRPVRRRHALIAVGG
jgi:hypothetical protein